MTHNQVRLRNSSHPSRSSASTALPAIRSEAGSRIRPSSRAPRPKLALSRANPQPGPTVATSTPPNAVPPIMAAFSPSRSSAFAGCSWSAGTVCGVSPAAAGYTNAAAAPLSTSMSASCQISARPVRTRAAAAPWLAAATRFATRITRCRGNRSASTPPKRVSSTCGMLRAASTSPRTAGVAPRSSTAKASATGAIAEPRKEANRPANSSRNGRCRSGASAPFTAAPAAGRAPPRR